MDNQASRQDSESENMPFDSFLLHPSSGDVLARQRESLYATAINLAAAISVASWTSRSLETQLEDAIRFLASEDTLPAQKLSEKLSRITMWLNTIQRHLEVHESRRVTAVTAAVDVHCAERSIISTPPGNPRPAVFQQHADDGHSCHGTSRSPESIQEHQCTARKRPLESKSEGSREARRKRPWDSEAGSEVHLFS
jgi:hypothetical protein